jgi:hypothetical protein
LEVILDTNAVSAFFDGVPEDGKTVTNSIDLRVTEARARPLACQPDQSYSPDQ